MGKTKWSKLRKWAVDNGMNDVAEKMVEIDKDERAKKRNEAKRILKENSSFIGYYNDVYPVQ